ncbi:MAG TPA: hypothetical protein PKD90_02875 [Phnomibacter sp.]|nr:hypothetical protein [Phnomibacter sp.]
MPTKPVHKEPTASNSRLLLRYLGFAFQLLAALAIALWIGRWADAKTKWNFPVFSFALPLLIIIGTLMKAVRDTAGKPGK